MTIKGKIAKLAVVATVGGAVALPASQAAAADNKTERAVIGALIGGVAGAALSNGDKGAMAIGAVAGAALGASTGKNKRDDRYRYGYRTSQPYYSSSRYNPYGYNGYGAYNGYTRYDNRTAYSRSYQPAYGYNTYGGYNGYNGYYGR